MQPIKLLIALAAVAIAAPAADNNPTAEAAAPATEAAAPATEDFDFDVDFADLEEPLIEKRCGPYPDRTVCLHQEGLACRYGCTGRPRKVAICAHECHLHATLACMDHGC